MKISAESARNFLCNAADKPTEQINTGYHITSLAEVIIITGSDYRSRNSSENSVPPGEQTEQTQLSCRIHEWSDQDSETDRHQNL